MSGTLYAADLTRGKVVKALVKHYKLDYKIEAPNDEFKKQFPLGLIPALVEKDGLKITECIAIAVRCMY